jgi:hypothetical protein
MCVNANCAEFLKTGIIAGISLHSDRSEVLNVFESPSNWSDRAYGVHVEKAWAYYYRECLIAFDHDSVCSITLALHFVGEKFFDWGSSFPAQNQALDAFCNYLREHNVAFERLPASSHVLDAIALTEGGVFVCVRPRVQTTVGADGTLLSTRSTPVVDTLVLRKANKA